MSGALRASEKIAVATLVGVARPEYRGHASSRVLGIVLSSALLLTLACGDASRDDTNASLPAIVIDTAPAVLLADDGTPERIFSGVTARRLSSGEIVVADQGSASIRVFGRDGRLVRTLARQGPGPGELQGAFRLAMCRDTVLAIGQPPTSPPGVHVFSGHEGYVRSTRPTVEGEAAITAVDCIGDGGLLVQRGRPFRVLSAPPDADALTPDTTTYGVLAADGRTVAWLPPAVTQVYVGYPWPNGPIPTAMSPHPFVPVTLVVASGDRVWFVETGGGTLQGFDAKGARMTSRQLTLPSQPFNSDELERHLARALREARRAIDTSKVNAIHASRFLPPTMPRISAAYAVEDGGLWLRLFSLDDAGEQRFIVVGSDGSEEASTVLPANFDVHHIGRDFVLGVRRDESGVESVVEFAFTRPSDRLP